MMGILIGTLFIVSGIPQTIRMLKRKSSADISLSMYLITALAIVLSLFVGTYEGATQLVTANALSLVLVSVNIGLIIYYR